MPRIQSQASPNTPQPRLLRLVDLLFAQPVLTARQVEAALGTCSAVYQLVRQAFNSHFHRLTS